MAADGADDADGDFLGKYGSKKSRIDGGKDMNDRTLGWPNLPDRVA